MKLLPGAGPRQRALFSLAGLSLGDALGERFFGPPGQTMGRIEDRWLPPRPWPYTDDTEMALSVVQTLLDHDAIDSDALAAHFAERYDPARGYGGGAHGLLQSLQQGTPWQLAAPAMFGGSGSFGNGAAMRVAPLGAYLAEQPLELVAEQAHRSSVVTHAHPEGAAGAIAVAVAAAVAWQQAEQGELDGRALIETVARSTPPGETREGIQRAANLTTDTAADRVAGILGSGQRVSAQDTVPFVIWCAARTLAGPFDVAIWTTLLGLGDRDTTCAMVGGIVALSCRNLPGEWLAAREPLPPGFALEPAQSSSSS